MRIVTNRRIEAVRVLLKLSKKDFQQLLKTTHFIYREVIEERKLVPSDWIETLHKQHNVNPTWLIAGVGSIFLNSKAS